MQEETPDKTCIEERSWTDSKKPATKETGLLEEPALPHLGLQLLASRLQENKFLSFKPPSLYFMMGAGAD